MTRRAPGSPDRQLLRALRAALGEFTVDRHRTQPWASVTFTGTHHSLLLSEIDDARADRLLLTLDEHEFGLSGHVVADVAAMLEQGEDGVRLRLEVLTLECA